MTNQSQVRFTITPEDDAIVRRIVLRAAKAGIIRPTKAAIRDLEMDIVATHANGCPLDFARWIDADDFNFAHDVVGIMRHIDRETGTLVRCFVPRFAARGR